VSVVNFHCETKPANLLQYIAGKTNGFTSVHLAIRPACVYKNMKMKDSLLGYSARGLLEVDRRFRGAYCLRRQDDDDGGNTHF
jgi:hypothetical protein